MGVYFAAILIQEALKYIHFDGGQVGLEVVEHVDDFKFFEHRHVGAAMDVFLG